MTEPIQYIDITEDDFFKKLGSYNGAYRVLCIEHEVVEKIEYYVDAQLHRTDGPAVVYTNGREYWYQNGKPHRLDGAAENLPDLYRKWWVNGKLHRSDGPAVEFNDGHKEWYQNGKLHRLDGPAREFKSGVKQYYLHGKKVNKTDHPAEQAKTIGSGMKPLKDDVAAKPAPFRKSV